MSSCPNCSHEIASGAKFCPECGIKMVEAGPADSLLGRTLHGKYRIQEELGRGSMGTVYLGEHVGLRKKVALKVLHKDLQLGEEALQRFQREGIAAGRFSHPNAIQIFDFDRDDQLTYLAMEYVDGGSLKQLIARQGRLPLDAAVGVMRQVLSALAAAHAQGIVHRDLKPENIMVWQDADGALAVKVLDFGLSKLADNRLELSLQTQPGRILGTPLYMAPEQWDGADVDARADLYAAGLILYELVSGEQPFRADSTSAALVKKAAGEVPSLRDRHPNLRGYAALDQFLGRALARDRDDRFQSAEQMQQALEAALAGRSAARRPRQRVAARPARRQRPAWLVPAAVAAAAVVVGGALWWFTRSGGGDAAAATRAPLVREVPAAERSEAQRTYLRRLDAAREHLRLRDARLAIGELDDALAMPEADPEALRLRGDAYRMRRELDTALLDYREALAGWKDYAAAHAGIGWVHLDRGELEPAATAFARARELDGEDAEALAGLGAARAGQGRLDEARPLLVQAEKLDPRSALVRYHAGRAHLLADDLDAATEAFQQATRNDSRFWPALAGLGETFERRGRNPDAIKSYDGALRLEPDAPQVRQRLAALLVAGGRFDEAAGHLTIALQQAPEQPELLVLQGLARHGRGDVAGAITDLEAARAHGSRDAHALCVLGILLLQGQRWADAEARLREAIDLDDSLALAHQNLGLARMKQGHYDEAAYCLQRALQLDDRSAFAHFTMAVLLKDYLGQRDGAVHHLTRYRELGGNDARVADWLRQLGQ